MSKVIFDVSMSLDGFVMATGVTPEEPLGKGGERLHDWALGGDPAGGELLAAAVAEAGAFIGGRRTYDDSLPWWGPNGPTGPARVPLFIVTHQEPGDVPEGGVYTFVTDGIESALRQAREVAGGKNIYVMGGPRRAPDPGRRPPDHLCDRSRASRSSCSRRSAAVLATTCCCWPRTAIQCCRKGS